jgi:hypothetical protein
LVEIKAREKFNRRHMVDIPRIKFFAQHRYRENWPFMDGHELEQQRGIEVTASEHAKTHQPNCRVAASTPGILFKNIAADRVVHSPVFHISGESRG